MQPAQPDLIKGALAGLVAGVPQVLLTQAEARLLGLPGRQADIGPRFVHRVGERLDTPPKHNERWLLAGLFHFGYAAGWGVLYALLQRWRAAIGVQHRCSHGSTRSRSVASPTRLGGGDTP